MTPLFAELDALGKLRNDDQTKLKDVNGLLKDISTSNLDNRMQREIQRLKNFVFTIVSDTKLAVVFKKSELSKTFTKDLLESY